MKKLFFTIISLLFLIEIPLYAQSVVSITQEITAEKATDSAKIEAIYDWITQNIRYDDFNKRQREGDTVLRQEPYNVVVFKKAVCIGYAKTLREMCRLSGIEAHVVEGWAKNANGSFEREGHAWNVVKINNNWYPLDATWDAGNGLTVSKKYFLKDPSVFVENHLPRDPIWQLLTALISVNCFIGNLKNCDNEKGNAPFNFSDSIRIWQALDSAQQVYNQSIRILNFNPNDLMALHNLADFYNHKATKTLAEYTQIRKEISDKKRPLKGKTMVLNLLESTANYLYSAQSIYQKLAEKNKKNAYTDAHLNYDSIAELLSVLGIEMAYVRQYFKE
jgi:Transglutaminase-like superfamily